MFYKAKCFNLQVLNFELNITVLYIYNLFYIEYVKHSAIQLELEQLLSKAFSFTK